jgi:two-component system sensor histidine kinase VicK
MSESADTELVFTSLLSSIPDAVVITDRNISVTYVNQKVLDMIGKPMESVVGQKWIQITELLNAQGDPVSVDHRPIVLAISAAEQVTFKNYYYVKNQDERVPVDITVSPIIKHEEVVGTISIIKNRSDEELVDLAKSEFVSLASHQLKTPLTAMSWYLEALLDGQMGEFNTKVRDYLESMYRSNTHMINLVNALLNVSRIELHRYAINPEPTDLCKMSDGVLKMVDYRLQAKHITLVKKYEEPAVHMNADKNLIHIVFQNLISNAIKYTPDGGTISIHIAYKDTKYMIEIIDNGYGIPEDQQAEVFKKLFRADNVKEKEPEGNGLGLYIVKSVVEQSGGNISFHSKVGSGTRFLITFPQSGMRQKPGDRQLL